MIPIGIIIEIILGLKVSLFGLVTLARNKAHNRSKQSKTIPKQSLLNGTVQFHNLDLTPNTIILDSQRQNSYYIHQVAVSRKYSLIFVDFTKSTIVLNSERQSSNRNFTKQACPIS